MIWIYNKKDDSFKIMIKVLLELTLWKPVMNIHPSMHILRFVFEREKTRREMWGKHKVISQALKRYILVEHCRTCTLVVPATWKGWDKRITWVKEFRNKLGNIANKTWYKVMRRAKSERQEERGGREREKEEGRGGRRNRSGQRRGDGERCKEDTRRSREIVMEVN